MVAVLVVALFVIIGVVLCLYCYKHLNNQRDKNNNRNELSHLVVDKTTEILSELQTHLLTETNHDVRKEVITSIKEIMLGQLSLCKKHSVTLGTQTSRESTKTTSRMSSQQNSTTEGDGGEDVADGPAAIQFAGEMNDHPPSYENTVAEKELADLLNSCISDIIQAQATLLQDDNCNGTNGTNSSHTIVTVTVTEDQKSTKAETQQPLIETTV